MASAQTIAPLVLSTITSLQASKLQNREIEDDRQRRLAEIRERTRTQQRQRQAELKRTSAKARARFGAQGRTAGGGSASAILNGLVAESRRLAEDDRRFSDLGIADVESTAKFARRRNLLQTRSAISGEWLDAGLSLLDQRQR